MIMAKRDFTSSEWNLLLNAPHWVFAALAAAERGTVSTRRTEAKALDEFLSGYRSGSSLVKEIIAGQEEADDKVKISLKKAQQALEQVGTLLEGKLSDMEGDPVRDMLMEAGAAIAKANREALFGDAESAKEAKALEMVATALKATDVDKRRRREASAEAARRAKEEAARAAARREREEAAKAKADAAAKAKADAAAATKAKAEAKAKVEAAAKARAEADAKAKAKAEAEAKAAEFKKRQEEARARREAAEKAREEAEKAAAEAAAAQRTYVVKKGDTLSGIAKKMLGKAGRWPEIFEANRDIIENPNLIRPGWELRIPD
jgi:LysM repeat protein